MDPIPLPHEELRRSIAAQGHTTAEAAKRLGVSAPYLSRVLRGEHVPTDPIRHRAEDLYSVASWRWDPRSLDRDALIRRGYRPGRLARELRLRPSLVLQWWRGGDVPLVAEKVAPLLGAGTWPR